jgi:hypothetical protein
MAGREEVGWLRGAGRTCAAPRRWLRAKRRDVGYALYEKTLATG